MFVRAKDFEMNGKVMILVISPLVSITKDQILNMKSIGDSSEIKISDGFFLNFSECSLPSTVSINKIKKMGRHSRKKVMMGQSFPHLCQTVLVLIMRVIHRSTLHFSMDS